MPEAPPPRYLEDLLPADLDAAVARLRLLLRQLLAQDLQLLHQVPLVLGHRQTLGLLRELCRGQGLRGRRGRLGLLLLLHLGGAAGGGQRRGGEGERRLTDFGASSCALWVFAGRRVWFWCRRFWAEGGPGTGRNRRGGYLGVNDNRGRSQREGEGCAREPCEHAHTAREGDARVPGIFT